MPTYNFKHEAEVYVVSGGTHRIHVTDISFGQTFSEESYSVSTIHSPNDLFEASVINKANAAKFDFSLPAIDEADYTIIETLLRSADSFTLYIKTAADTFKLETAVITNGSFVIEKSRPLSISIQGEASKLLRGQTFSSTSVVSPRSYIIPSVVDVTLNNSLLDSIIGVTIELQNDIQWNPYTTVGGAIAATSASNSMYPSEFTISKKILSGSITQYLNDSNTTNTQQWDDNATLSITAGDGRTGSFFRGFSFGPATCSFTNRLTVGAVFFQNYDWRVVSNAASLSSILNYITD